MDPLSYAAAHVPSDRLQTSPAWWRTHRSEASPVGYRRTAGPIPPVPLGTRAAVVRLKNPVGSGMIKVTCIQHTTIHLGRGIAVRARQIHLRKIAQKLPKICGKLRCRNQTSRSLNEQHFGTGDTQGTHKHAKRTGKRRENCGKLQKISRNCGPQSPPDKFHQGGGGLTSYPGPTAV